MIRTFLFLFFLISFSSFSQKSKAKEFYNRIVNESGHIFYKELFNPNREKKSNLTIEELNELLLISKNNKNTLIEICILEELSFRYIRLYKFDAATEKTLRVISLVNSMDSRQYSQKLLICSYNVLGVIYRKKFDAQRTIDYHNRALGLASKYENPDKIILKNISVARKSIGEAYRGLHQYELAIDEQDIAIAIDKKIKDTKLLAISYLCKGKSYEGLKDFEKAFYFYSKALDIENKLGSIRGQVICNNKIANYYLEKAKRTATSELSYSFYKKALEKAEYNFQMVNQLNDKQYSAKIIGKLGKIKKYLGDLDGAELNLKHSCDIFENINYKPLNYSVNCKELSDLYEKTGEFEKAIKYLKRAVIEDEKVFGGRSSMYISNLISKQDNYANEIKLQQLQKITKEKEFEVSKSRNILIITVITLALLAVALYSIYHQGVLNNDKKVLRLEQQALQAQMNPHFIFNALNSIKLYIIKKDQRQAVYFLNKFAKLIRNILNSSTKKEISLNEELETIQLYVTIENIRFNNEIVYECIVEDKNLATDTIKVPPLILQPFLENAIWHGLSSKLEDKKIKLTVSAISDLLLEIRIKDNGVGRKQAMSLKEAKTLKRKSIGIDLTEERLKTFSSDFSEISYIEYIDLLDDNGKSLGTEVVIGIPLK